jgi:hypothetical protein
LSENVSDDASIIIWTFDCTFYWQQRHGGLVIAPALFQTSNTSIIIWSFDCTFYWRQCHCGSVIATALFQISNTGMFIIILTFYSARFIDDNVIVVQWLCLPFFFKLLFHSSASKLWLPTIIRPENW